MNSTKLMLSGICILLVTILLDEYYFIAHPVVPVIGLILFAIGLIKRDTRNL